MGFNKEELEINRKNVTQFFKNRFSIKRLVMIIIILVILLTSLFFVPFFNYVINPNYENSIKLDDDLKVNFVDVGQGDGIIISLPDGKTMIIDTGDNKSSNRFLDHLSKIANNKIVDYLILTHSDTDHIGKSSKVLEEYDVKNIYRPNQYLDSDIDEKPSTSYGLVSLDNYIFRELVENINDEKKNGANVFVNKAGIIIESKNLENNYKFTFLSPNLDNYDEINDFSPIILLEYRTNKIIFTGDATDTNEAEVINYYNNISPSCSLNIDLLKVAHHGSNYSTSDDFLKLLSPKNAIISVSKDNSYNLPNSNLIDRLNNFNIKTYRTDEIGNIVAGYSNGKFVITTNNGGINFYFKWYLFTIFIFCVLFVLIFYKKVINNYELKNK
jgi:competence protein ComEC